MAKQQTRRLPSWAVFDEAKNEIRVDVDLAYPKYLGLLDLDETAHNVGVCRLCITRDLRDLLGDQDGPVPVVRFMPLATQPDATDEQRAACRARWSAGNLKHNGNPIEEDAAGMRHGGTFRRKLNDRRAAAALALE